MSKNRPLISVVVPIYKVEDYLPRCLDSLLAQTWTDFELVLVDDGSPDGCWEILERYAAKDARVRIFRKENGGVSSARNFGMDAAKGEYIGFVDPDDWVSPHYLEWMYEALTEQGTRMALAGYADVQEYKPPVMELTPRPAARKVTTETYTIGGQSAGGQAWRTLYHKSVVDGLRFDKDLGYAEDILFYIRALTHAGEYAYLDAPLYYYLKRSGSAMEQPFRIKQYDEIEGWKRAFEAVRNQPEALKKAVETRLVIAYAHVYYRMSNSPYADEEKQQVLRREAWKHKRAAWRMSAENMREKGKVLTLLYSPRLGSLIWKAGTARKNARKK